MDAEYDYQKGEEILEAVLFAAGEPMECSRLAAALEIDEFTLKQLLDRLETRYAAGGGIALWHTGERYQLTTKPAYVAWVRRAMEIRRDVPLSSAALEVLSVIAYRQPVTKAYIEQIRGVDCSGVLSTLILKQLVEEQGRLELPGRPLVYGTTDNFLRCFGIEELSQLPDLTQLEVEAGQNAAETASESDDGQLSIDGAAE